MIPEINRISHHSLRKLCGWTPAGELSLSSIKPFPPAAEPDTSRQQAWNRRCWRIKGRRRMRFYCSPRLWCTVSSVHLCLEHGTGIDSPEWPVVNRKYDVTMPSRTRAAAQSWKSETNTVLKSGSCPDYHHWDQSFDCWRVRWVAAK